MFIRPAQMVRYRIVMLRLDPDPERPGGVPCLVRDQGRYTWDGSGFNGGDESGIGAAPRSRQIVTENVSGFKVYLSANGGRDWAGLGLGLTGFDQGWNGAGGMRSLIDKQLLASGRPGFQTTRGREHWFREVPVLVGVDLATRTATRRAEFSRERKEPAHKELAQSLIFVPKHFGLPMN
jgi:hypothetical protein